MTPEFLAWAIFAAPLASFLIIVFVLRPLGAHTAAGSVTILAMGIAFVLSLVTLGTVFGAPGHELHLADYPWITLGEVQFHVGLAVDSLTAMMLVVVTSVSLLVQIYSTGYMHGDTGYSRYFAYMSLFTTSMLGLVLADNLLQVFFFWELVGLCSYLLIGFWFHRPAAVTAAKKAFLVTRFGDLGFLAALLIIVNQTGTLTISALFEEHSVEALMHAGFLGFPIITWATLGIFAGAAGKSAQFPLHVWLPDAMEGPTPVSALIHAATMVAAGVYLVGRMLPLFVHAPDTMAVIAFLGAFTAITAAGLGLVVTDIKRVMAYSTVSQLGYMMLALGLGGYVAAFFHLMNHAFFKALLFLGAGSVNHTSGTFNMLHMGGLRKAMPITWITLFIASLSLSGIPPFSGFWSKDEILGEAFAKSPVLFAMALITVFLTAFYVFRMLFLTFSGEYRGGVEAEMGEHVEPANPHDGQEDDHTADSGHGLHESPSAMTVPLIILAVPAIFSGLANLPGVHFLSDFLQTEAIHEALGEHALPFDPILAIVSTLVALSGIWLAWQMYEVKAISPTIFSRLLWGVPAYVLNQKYGLDLLFERVITHILTYSAIANGLAGFDRYGVDGVVNGVGQLTKLCGDGLRRLQTGQVQAYGMAIFLGTVVIAAGLIIRG